jgi:lipid A 3-O-deacylase PagL
MSISRHAGHFCLLLFFAFLGLPVLALAQDQAPAPAPAQVTLYPPASEFGVWGAVALNTPHAFGITSNEQIYTVGFRYGHTIFDTASKSLEYTLDIVPVQLVHQYTFESCGTHSRLGFICPTGRETVWGGGVNPIGLKMNFRRSQKWQPYIAAAGGFITSVRPVPVDTPGGTQYNYTFDAGAGLEIFSASRRSSWKIAYRFQHISNAYRHSFNPGLDNNQISVAYSFFK